MAAVAVHPGPGDRVRHADRVDPAAINPLS
jgi:hypothetical protein